MLYSRSQICFKIVSQKFTFCMKLGLDRQLTFIFFMLSCFTNINLVGEDCVYSLFCFCFCFSVFTFTYNYNVDNNQNFRSSRLHSFSFILIYETSIITMDTCSKIQFKVTAQLIHDYCRTDIPCMHATLCLI